MKCEKCGATIEKLEILEFARDGSDNFNDRYFAQYDVNAVAIETDSNWCGYELTEEEMRECIRCPHCHQFPFESTEIQSYEIVRLVMFRKADNVTRPEPGESVWRDDALAKIRELQKTDPAMLGKKQYADGYLAGLDEAEIILMGLPAASIEADEGEMIDGGCNRCGWYGDCVDTPYYKFCPGCGRKMKNVKLD